MLAETPHDEAMEHVTDDMIYDLMLCGEQREAASLVKEYAAAAKQKSESRARAVAVARKTFAKASSAPKPAAKKKAATAAAAKAAAAVAKDLGKRVERWHADFAKDAHAVVVDAAPKVGHIFVDQFNGRFRVTYPGKSAKSFSWTLRGVQEAGRLALSCAWSWHTDATGERAPEHVCMALGL